MRVVETISGKEILALPMPSMVCCLTFVENDTRLITEHGEGFGQRNTGVITTWDLKTGKELSAVKLAGSSTPYVFSADGKLIASWNVLRDTNIKLWDVAAGKELATLASSHTKTLKALAFSPDGKLFASGDTAGKVILWDVATAKEIATMPGKAKSVDALAFSPDGKTLAAGGEAPVLQMWDVASKQLKPAQPTSPQVERGFFWAVDFSPDGKYLYSGLRGTWVWDVSTGKAVKWVPGHREFVRRIAVSPDGKWLASSSYDSTKIWDLAKVPDK